MVDVVPDAGVLVGRFQEALLAVDRVAAREVLQEAAGKWPGLQAGESLIAPVLEQIGCRWEEGQISLVQVYMSANICEQLVDEILVPADAPRSAASQIAIATLEDYHLLGKRIVSSMLRASGFALHDYGRGDVEELVAQVKKDGIRILLVSTLMLRSALRVKELRSRMDEEGCDTRIVVGGAPFRFDGDLWREVNADAMGRDASEAVAVVARLVEEGRS